jgi:hypothetical protein
MFSPTVTELPRSLEPISPDTFNEPGRVAPASPGGDRRGNVVALRPVADGARRQGLAAA